MRTLIRTGIGQDSHRFLPKEATKPCILGGLIFKDAPGFLANSDGDVIFHAICNAITSLTHVVILGGKADELYKNDGITDSRVYLEGALKTLGNQKIVHVAITIEGTKPKVTPQHVALRLSIADALGIDFSQVGLTATTGEGLTDFGCGLGVQVFCLLTTEEKLN